jgi:MFS family permease
MRELKYIRSEVNVDLHSFDSVHEQRELTSNIENDGLEKDEDSQGLLNPHKNDENIDLVAVTEDIKQEQNIPEDNNNNSNSNSNSFFKIFSIFFFKYPTRFIYAISLMISQAFFYNGLYYTFGLVLENYFSVAKEDYGIYLIPLSFSNFFGPIILGPLFDKWSRRYMIFLSYFTSGVLLTICGISFILNILTPSYQLILWSVIFFIASPGASSAHLTVSEIFPIEIRSQALAFFFSIGLLIGGVISPLIFGSLISPGNRISFSLAYFLSSFLMIGSSIITLIYGVDAERKPLESLS